MGAWWCVPCMNFMVSTGGRCASFGGCPPLVVRSPLHRGIFPAESGQNVAKVRFYLLALVFSRGSWRQQTAKPKYILESGVCVWGRVCLSWWCSIVSTGGICAGFRTFRTCRMPALVLWCHVPAFLSAFSLCLWCIMLEYGSVSRF